MVSPTSHSGTQLDPNTTAEGIANICKLLNSKEPKVVRKQIKRLTDKPDLIDIYKKKYDDTATPAKMHRDLHFILSKVEPENPLYQRIDRASYAIIKDSPEEQVVQQILEQSNLLRHGTNEQIDAAARFFIQFLPDPKVQHCIIEIGLLKDLLKVLHDPNRPQRIRFDLACGMAEFCERNVEHGLKVLKDLLELTPSKVENHGIIEKAALCLANIAAKNISFRDQIMRSGIMESASMILKREYQNELDRVYAGITKLIFNIHNQKPLPLWEDSKISFDAIIYLLRVCDCIQVVRQCLWTLALLTHHPKARAILLTNVHLELLHNFLNIGYKSQKGDSPEEINSPIRIDAARVIRPLALRGTEQVTILLTPFKSMLKNRPDINFLNTLKEMVDMNGPTTRTDEERVEILQMLGTILVNATEAQIQQIADAEMLSILKSLLSLKDTFFEKYRGPVRIEAARVIGLIARSGAVQVASLLRPELNLLPILKEMSDPEDRTRTIEEIQEGSQVLANITAKATGDQRQQIVDAGTLPMLMAILDMDEESY